MKTVERLNLVLAINNSRGFKAAQNKAANKLKDIDPALIEDEISTPEWEKYVDSIIKDTYSIFFEFDCGHVA